MFRSRISKDFPRRVTIRHAEHRREIFFQIDPRPRVVKDNETTIFKIFSKNPLDNNLLKWWGSESFTGDILT